MAARPPQLRDGILTFSAPDTPPIRIDTAAWQHWLLQPTTRSFGYTGPTGSFEARRERRQRGGSYWVAYRKHAGTLHQCYLGSASDLTSEQLATAAITLTTAAATTATSAAEDRVLLTKLFVPQAVPDSIQRVSTQAKFERCLTHPLTIVTSPAGFGKTTVVADWARAQSQPVGWLSLEPADNELRRFLRYLIAACQRTLPGCGDAAALIVAARGPLRSNAALTSLINDFSVAPAVGWLILDDYHVIATDAIHEALLFLIEHAPPNLRLVLISRMDPPLPLARLRARGVAAELRAADLRFNLADAEALLQPVLPVSPSDVALLTERTEGWAVGLRLAALALAGVPDLAVAIRSFSGNQQYVVDYLFSEVFSRQTAEIQSLLLTTAVLDQICADLCAALLVDTGVRDCQTKIEQLEQRGLFLTALDAERRWFRYHHLFGDMLRQRAQQDRSRWRVLHQRASAWFEQNAHSGGTSFLDKAVAHACAAEEWASAARMIDAAADALSDRGDIPTLLRWLTRIPEHVRAELPEMSFCYGFTLSMSGQSAAAAPWIDRAAQIWQAQASPRMASVFELRAHIARTRFEPEQAIRYANAALAILSHAPIDQRASLLLVIGTSHSMLGESGAALDALDEATQLAARKQSPLLNAMVSCGLAAVYLQRGRLHAAAERYRFALTALADGAAWPLVDALAQLGALAYEWNDLADAAYYTQQAVTIAAQISIGGALLARNAMTLAQLGQVHGDDHAAHVAIAQAVESATAIANQPIERQARALGAQLDLARGDLAAAQRWRAGAGVAANDHIHFLREFEYMLLARLLIAEGSAAQALAPLERIRQRAEVQGRVRSQLQATLLLALAHEGCGATAAALLALTQALELGRAESFRRLFLDEGPALERLLIRLSNTRHSRDAAAPTMLAYAAQLLALLPAQHTVALPQPSALLVEPLSERECAVLRLVASGASNQEIAQHLVLAPATVKKHIGNILGKLEAHSRTHAVARARELGML